MDWIEFISISSTHLDMYNETSLGEIFLHLSNIAVDQ